MNILVTGANGFIGKHICTFLEEQDHNVYKIVRQKQEPQTNTICADLADNNSVATVIKKLNKTNIDLIIHLASKLVNINQDESEQVQVLIDNIQITKNIVDLAKQLNPTKLINFSSMAVYPNKNGDFTEDSQIKMSDNVECLYGLSKFCSENIIDHMLKGQPLKISHLRVSQVYGEGMREDRIFSIMLKELEEKNTITVFGNGERESNFININKLFQLLNYFILNDICGIYNVGDEVLSYLDLAQKIIREKGNKDSSIIKKEEGSKAKFSLNTNKLKQLMESNLNK